MFLLNKASGLEISNIVKNAQKAGARHVEDLASFNAPTERTTGFVGGVAPIVHRASIVLGCGPYGFFPWRTCSADTDACLFTT